MKNKNKKYTYYQAGNKVICVGRYARIPFKGVASCSPEDSFDLETGKEIARKRCEYKIAKRRLRDLEERVNWAERCMAQSLADFEKVGQLYNEVFLDFQKAAKENEETFNRK